jgi:hypothetical protein
MNFLKTGDKIMSKLLFIFILFFTSSVQATWWIQDLSQPTEGEIEIFRGEDKLPVLFLMPLQKGDILHLPENATLTLVNSANEKEQLTAEKSPFSVPDSASLPTLWDNVLASLSRWFTTKMGQDTVVVSLTTRGDKLTLKGGPYLPLKLFPDTEELTLYWKGGQAPYTLQLKSEQGKTISTVGKVEENVATLSFDPLKSGHYTLSLSDSSDKNQQVAIKLHVTDELPQEALAIQQSDLPQAIRESYLAMWLVADPAWRLEGLRLLREQGLDKVVARVVEKGDLPEF